MDEYYIDSAGNKFVWDTVKDKLNFRKHGLTFEAAVKVFSDSENVLVYDENHSVDEDRYKVIGMIRGALVIAVIATQRGEYKRLISARRASKEEKETYYDEYRAKTSR